VKNSANCNELLNFKAYITKVGIGQV